MSNVHSVPRKQGRRLACTDFVHLRRKEKYLCEFFFLAVLNLSNGDIHFLETRSENWCGFQTLKTSVKNNVFWSEIESGFGEPGGTFPPRSTSPPPFLPESFTIVSANYKSSLLSAIYAGFPWYSRIKWDTGSAGRPGATWTPGKRRCKRTNW